MRRGETRVGKEKQDHFPDIYLIKPILDMTHWYGQRAPKSHTLRPLTKETSEDNKANTGTHIPVLILLGCLDFFW
jgi:hypothetical protein